MRQDGHVFGTEGPIYTTTFSGVNGHLKQNHTKAGFRVERIRERYSSCCHVNSKWSVFMRTTAAGTRACPNTQLSTTKR